MKTQRFSTTLVTGNGRVAVLLAPLLLACTFFVSAQQDCEEALLFTILGGKTVGYERTQAVKPDSLRRITPEDVAAVVPKPYVGPYSARKFAPHDAFNTLFGDEDADNEFWESPGRPCGCSLLESGQQEEHAGPLHLHQGDDRG